MKVAQKPYKCRIFSAAPLQFLLFSKILLLKIFSTAHESCKTCPNQFSPSSKLAIKDTPRANPSTTEWWYGKATRGYRASGGASTRTSACYRHFRIANYRACTLLSLRRSATRTRQQQFLLPSKKQLQGGAGRRATKTRCAVSFVLFFVRPPLLPSHLSLYRFPFKGRAGHGAFGQEHLSAPSFRTEQI